MAEEFVGPVIVRRPTGQPSDTDVAKFEGNVNLDGTVKTTHVSAAGNISARGNVNGGALNTGPVTLIGNVPASGQGGAGAKSVRCMLKCETDDVLKVQHLSAVGNISAGNNVNAKFMNVSDMISATRLHASDSINTVSLKVAGLIHTGHLSAGGNISAANNVNARRIHVKEDVILNNGDCAEEFDLEDPSAGAPSRGSVMVIGKGGGVRVSASPYDRRVVGVISGEGDYKPAIILDRRASDHQRPAVALMGKVLCKVDCSNGSIEIGDLLTTSTMLGHAMKATDSSRAFGAVIGKALQPLSEAQGLIPILIALQ
jgi:hypothetical protein